MISFACPACGKTLNAGEEHSGKKARCTGCKAAVLIPPSPAGDAFQVDDASEPEPIVSTALPPRVTPPPPPAVAATPRPASVATSPPLYMGYLEVYAHLLTWLGGIQFVICVLLLLAQATNEGPSTSSQSTSTYVGIGIGSFGLMIGCFLTSAMVFLFVEMAKDIRSMRADLKSLADGV